MSSKSRRRIHRDPVRRVLMATAGVGLAAALAACASSSQAPTSTPARRTGFLGDYSNLAPGGPGEPQFLYVDRNADFSKYERIWIETVTIWQEGRVAKIARKDAQLLTDTLYASLEARLGMDYIVVSGPGPGVMGLRVAVTEVKGAKLMLNITTNAPPQLSLAPPGERPDPHTVAFVGAAAIEAELSDSTTGRELMDIVDERVVGNSVGASFGRWEQVEDAFDDWADRLRALLEQRRAS